MKSTRAAPIDFQLRSQVVSLRRAGMTVAEICDRLDLDRAMDQNAVQMICDALPRKYGLGDLTTPGPSYRRTGSQ